MRRDGNISPFSEAAKALKSLLTKNPRHFVSSEAISALGVGWEVSYAASNRTDILTTEDRTCLCEGICNVLACWPEAQRPKSILALAMPTLNCLEMMLNHAMQSKQNDALLEATLHRLASEVIIVGTIASSFSRALNAEKGNDRVAIQGPALNIVRRVLPCLLTVAKEFSNKKVNTVHWLWLWSKTRLTRVYYLLSYVSQCIADALGEFLVLCAPGSCSDEQSSNILDELYQLTVTKDEGRLLCGESTEEL